MAWTRTSLGVLANGVLLLLKYLHTEAPPINLMAAAFATMVTLWIYVIGRRRQKLLARQPFPARISPGRDAYVVASLVGALILVSLASVLG